MSYPDPSNVTWKPVDWSHDTILSVLLPGGGVMWQDPDTKDWHLDPAGSVPVHHHDEAALPSCVRCAGDGVVYHRADGDGLADSTCPACGGSGLP